MIFGASGAGGAIVRELAARGKPVRSLTRTGKGHYPEGIQAVAADAADPVSAKAACAGATVVYHAVNVPYPDWTSALPPVMDSLITAAGAANATLVYVDNAYAYVPVDRLMIEGMPDAATTKKGRLRAQLAARLLAAHQAGTVRAAIGRGSDYFGPGATNPSPGIGSSPPSWLERRQCGWAASINRTR